MKDTKLVRALSTLTKEEWRSFRKHLLSYTGSKSEIYALFSIFQKNKTRLNDLGDPNEFKTQYFPHLRQKSFFVMSSKVYKCLEDWLAINEFNEEEYQRELFLIKALFKKGLVQEARAHANKLKVKLNKCENLDFNINKILAEVDHLIYYNVNKDSIETRNKMLASLSENYALAYKERSTFYMAELMNRDNIYRIGYDELIAKLNSSTSSLEDSELTEIGNSIFEVFSYKDPDHLNKLINTLLAKKIKDNSELENLVMSYITRLIRMLYGLDSFKKVKNIFPFFSYQFDSIMKKSSGKISSIQFHNTIDVLGNYLSLAQTIEFIDRWVQFVETPKVKETKDLAYAQVHFINRDFENMRPYSQHISFNNFGQRTRALLHNLICLYIYRNEDYNLPIQSLKSFKAYLRRNKKSYSKIFFDSNYNFASILEKLIRNDFTPQVINLEDYKKVFYKKWITEEINRAKKNK